MRNEYDFSKGVRGNYHVAVKILRNRRKFKITTLWTQPHRERIWRFPRSFGHLLFSMKELYKVT